MRTRKNKMDYWFTIEPYVYIKVTNKSALLYNTLDGVSVESDKIEVIQLLEETLKEENCGVILLTSERYGDIILNNFIKELREKYMADIIDVKLSSGKPVQMLPLTNMFDRDEAYRKKKSTENKNVLENLSEITIHIDYTTNIAMLISFMQSIPNQVTFNICGNNDHYNDLVNFLNHLSSPKYILCSYLDIINIKNIYENNFSYKISVHFPINMQQFEISRQTLLNFALPFEYIFDVTSNDDYFHAEKIIEQFQIKRYRLNPVYNGENLHFFEENVFLTREDILSTSMDLKDLFAHQLINVYDFGKINIMPNGDAYANLHHPILGNIYTHSIYEIVHKEMKEGLSWFNIRNQAPCNDCVYQWLCPSPSKYEAAMGRNNLCHIK